jgi:hypothetical protein
MSTEMVRALVFENCHNTIQSGFDLGIARMTSCPAPSRCRKNCIALPRFFRLTGIVAGIGIEFAFSGVLVCARLSVCSTAKFNRRKRHTLAGDASDVFVLFGFRRG